MRLHHVTLALGISVALWRVRPLCPARARCPARDACRQAVAAGADAGRAARRARHLASRDPRHPFAQPCPKQRGGIRRAGNRKGEAEPEQDCGSARRRDSVSAVGGCSSEEAGLRVRDGDQARAHRHGDPVSGARRAKAELFPSIQDYAAGGKRRVRLGRSPRVSGHPLDGRPHVGPDVKLWMGDGRGRWEGNTLVVDTRNLKAKSRLDVVGDFFTDKAHLVERMTFVDANTMNYEATIDDPTVFTRPWTMRVVQRRLPDDEMWEWACHEGERDAARSFLGTPDTEKQ